MYTKCRKRILEIDILVTLVLLTEADFRCALYDFGESNDPLFRHDKQHQTHCVTPFDGEAYRENYTTQDIRCIKFSTYFLAMLTLYAA